MKEQEKLKECVIDNIHVCIKDCCNNKECKIRVIQDESGFSSGIGILPSRNINIIKEKQ